MASLADKAILSGAENRPPMLEKDMYDSWRKDGVTRLKKYSELSRAEAIQADCDVKATNIILQALPLEIYALFVLQGSSSSNLSISYLMNDTSSTINHNVYMASAPQIDYAPIAHHPSEFSSPKTGLVVALMANLSHYGSDNLAEVNNQSYMNNHLIPQEMQVPSTSEQSTILAQSNTKSTSDSNIISYSKYMNESQYNTVQNSTLPASQDDLILFVIEQLRTQVVNCTKINQDNKQVNELLTAEFERYINQERVLKKQMNDNQASTSYENSLEIETLKHTLSEHLKEKESLTQKITLLKNDFQKEEYRNIDRELALEKQVKELNNIVVFYNHSTRQALGFQNPFYLKKAQQLKLKLYDGCVIEKSKAIMVPDTEETLMLAEESRSKMIKKQNDPQMIEKKVITKPINYAIINQLSTDFETRLVPQTESSAEQAFWSQYLVQPDEPNIYGTTIV
nr:hypothetical protein [Tanacetum cinerariifolium]